MFTVLDRDDSIWFVVGDNPLCVMLYDGFLIYASTQEILCKAHEKAAAESAHRHSRTAGGRDIED